nr:uncharacterized protein LOC129056137 [Pongo abelii]
MAVTLTKDECRPQWRSNHSEGRGRSKIRKETKDSGQRGGNQESEDSGAKGGKVPRKSDRLHPTLVPLTKAEQVKRRAQGRPVVSSNKELRQQKPLFTPGLKGVGSQDHSSELRKEMTTSKCLPWASFRTAVVTRGLCEFIFSFVSLTKVEKKNRKLSVCSLCKSLTLCFPTLQPFATGEDLIIVSEEQEKEIASLKSWKALQAPLSEGQVWPGCCAVFLVNDCLLSKDLNLTDSCSLHPPERGKLTGCFLPKLHFLLLL